MRSSAAIAVGILVPALACERSADRASTWSDWRSRTDTALWHFVTEDGTTCRDCISLEEVLIIGDPEGPGYHEESQWVTRDSIGRYWVGGVGRQKVYGPEGDFLRQVGRTGAGPLEFRGVGPTFTDAMGQVHVFDQRNRRETVIGPQFDLISEHSLPWGPIYHAAPLPDAEHIIVNGVFREPSRIGLPLHMIRGPDIVASFGMIERGSYSLGTMHMLRRVTIDRDGTIFSGNYFDYSVEAWSPSGQRLLGFKRDGLWQPPPDGQPQPLSRETNLWGLLLAMNVDENDRLWVITWAPREDWLSNVSEGVGPDGQTHLRPRDSDASIRRTAIDVIDLGSGRLVAHRQYDELLYGFLGHRSVFGNRFTSAGEPRLVIWKVDLKEREQ